MDSDVIEAYLRFCAFVAAVIVACLLCLAFCAGAAFATLPTHEVIVTDRVDLVEVNHFHDGQAKLLFSQLLFWQWHERDGKFHIVDWRLVKSEAMEPRRDYARRRYVATIPAGQFSDRTCEVWADDYRETWTQVDPELIDRESWPIEKRRKLTTK